MRDLRSFGIEQCRRLKTSRKMSSTRVQPIHSGTTRSTWRVISVSRLQRRSWS